MSDRQARNRRKARKRLDKLIASAEALPAPAGWTFNCHTFDYGRVLALCIQRDTDGLRNGVSTFADRLYRHMDAVPQRLAGRLLAWSPVTPE